MMVGGGRTRPGMGKVLGTIKDSLGMIKMRVGKTMGSIGMVNPIKSIKMGSIVST
jgi:hypothetical protein